MAIIDVSRIPLTGIKLIDFEYATLVDLINYFFENMLTCHSLEEELSLTQQFIGSYTRQMEKYLNTETQYGPPLPCQEVAERRQRQESLIRQLRTFCGQDLTYGSSFEIFQLAIKGLTQNFIPKNSAD